MQLQLGIMHVFMYVQLSIMVLWDLPNMHVNWLKEEDEEHPSKQHKIHKSTVAMAFINDNIKKL